MRRALAMHHRWSLAALTAIAVSPLVVSLATAPAVDAAPPATEPRVVEDVPVVTTAKSLKSSPVKKFDRKVKNRLKKRISSTGLGRSASVRVVNPSGPGAVMGRTPRKQRIPASNMKLVTAANALSRLGAGTRLPTVVTPRAGGGSKAVVIVGGGDPLLRKRDVQALADRAAVTLAARRPSGRLPATVPVWVDDSLFRSPGSAPGWRSAYLGRYVSPVRALGTLGTVSSDTSIAAAHVFAQRLRSKHGVKAPVKGRAAADRSVELARFAGHTVGDAVDAMLLHSNNQVAETLHRQVAVRTGHPGTWKGSRKAARASLKRLRVPVKGVRIHDGSGLSRSNRLNARALAKLLRVASKRPALRSLAGGLPTSGRTGTLSNRFRHASSYCARGRVVAKTGYLDHVVALSGYAHGVDGRTRSFSILVNNPPRHLSVAAVQQRVDRLAATITGCT